MNLANEISNRWLDAKNEINRLYVLALVEAGGKANAQKLYSLIEKIGAQVGIIEKIVREMSNYDLKCINERDETIKYLQDKLASREE